MKSLFAISLAAVVASGLALVALSAMTLVPGSVLAKARAPLFFGVSGFLVVWLGLAVWARFSIAKGLSPSRWIARSLIGFGVVYCLSIIFGLIG